MVVDWVVLGLLVFTYAMRRFEIIQDQHAPIPQSEVEQFLREVREL